MSVEAAPVSDDLETVEPVDQVDELLACTNDPLSFVEKAFPDVVLEDWQRQVLSHIGLQLSENQRLSSFKAIMCAVASGNGVGKTALLAWLILWALTTFEDCIGVVTAGSEGQLRTRLWGELSKWHSKLPDDLREQFQLTATSLFNVQHERTWRADGRAWTERNKESWSGVHNYQKRVIIIYDECAMIPPSIWEAMEIFQR